MTSIRTFLLLLALAPVRTHGLFAALHEHAPDANTTQVLGFCGSQNAKLEARAGYYWANKNGDASCSGATEHVAPSNLASGPTWSFKDRTQSLVSAHPCIDDHKNIYQANRNGVVRKFSADGKLRWENSENFKRQSDEIVVGGCVIMAGSLYVGATTGNVTAIDMETGKTRWQARPTSSAGGDSWSIAAHNGLVIVVGRVLPRQRRPDFGGNDDILALDARNGKTVWTFHLPGREVYNFLGSFVDSPPSIIFSDASGVPHRLRLCDGIELWRNDKHIMEKGERIGFTTGGAAVDAAQGLAYVTNNILDSYGAEHHNEKMHGKVTAYNVETGAFVWQRTLTMPANNAPVVGKLGRGQRKSVVIAIGANPWFPDAEAERTGFYKDGEPVGWDSEVLAFDSLTGEPSKWHFRPPTYKKPEAYGDKAYGDQNPGHICLPDAWSNGAIGGDSTVYIGHMSGNIFALQDRNDDGVLEEGKGEISRYFGGRCYQGSPGIAPGLLVATPCDGLHVFGA